jgi:biopolymer transport protein ExbD
VAATLRRPGLVAGWLHVTALGHEPPSVSPVPSVSSLVPAETPVAPEWDVTIDHALAELPEEDRAAILLHHVEGRPLTEVGAALDLGADAAALRLSRALDKLRSTLAGRGLRLGVSPLRDLLAEGQEIAVPTDRIRELGRLGLARRPSEHDSEVTTFFGSVIALLNSGTALGVAALVVAGTTLAWGYRTNARLEGEITRLHGDNQTLASLQRDNRRLARLVAEAEQLRRDAAELPALRAAVFPAGPQAATGRVVVTIGAGKQWRWDNEELPADAIAGRLREFHQRYPGSETTVVIRANGVGAADVLAVIEEVRKAHVVQIQIEGETRFESGAGGWLF